MTRTETTAMLSKLVEKRLKNQTAFWASEVNFDRNTPDERRVDYVGCTKELCDEIVWQKMVPERVNAILTPDSTGSKLILGHVQSYNDMSYRRRPASEILWAMVKANGKRTN